MAVAHRQRVFKRKKAPENVRAILAAADSQRPKLRNTLLPLLHGLKAETRAYSLAWDRADVAGVLASFPWEEWQRSVKEGVQPILKETMAKAAKAAARHTHVRKQSTLAGAFDLTNLRAVVSAERLAAELVTQITNATKEAIRQLVTRALDRRLRSEMVGGGFTVGELYGQAGPGTASAIGGRGVLSTPDPFTSGELQRRIEETLRAIVQDLGALDMPRANQLRKFIENYAETQLANLDVTRGLIPPRRRRGEERGPRLVPVVRSADDPSVVIQGPSHPSIMNWAWQQGIRMGEDIRMEPLFMHPRTRQIYTRAEAGAYMRREGYDVPTDMRAEYLDDWEQIPFRVHRGVEDRRPQFVLTHEDISQGESVGIFRAVPKHLEAQFTRYMEEVLRSGSVSGDKVVDTMNRLLGTNVRVTSSFGEGLYGGALTPNVLLKLEGADRQFMEALAAARGRLFGQEAEAGYKHFALPEPEWSTIGRRVHSAHFGRPPEGYVRLYRGAGPDLQEAGDTRGRRFVTSYDEAVNRANVDFLVEGGGLGPGRSVLMLDVPLEDALRYAQAVDPGATMEDLAPFPDPAVPIELLVDEEALKEVLHIKGEIAQSNRDQGRPVPKRGGVFGGMLLSGDTDAIVSALKDAGYDGTVDVDSGLVTVIDFDAERHTFAEFVDGVSDAMTAAGLDPDTSLDLFEGVYLGSQDYEAALAVAGGDEALADLFAQEILPAYERFAHEHGLDPRADLRRIRDQLYRDPGQRALDRNPIERFRNKLIHRRAEVIARHETMRAANAGQYELWQQAIEAGLLPGDVTREWVVVDDERLCPICEPFKGKQAKMDEMFAAKVPRRRRQKTEPPILPQETTEPKPGSEYGSDLTDALEEYAQYAQEYHAAGSTPMSFVEWLPTVRPMLAAGLHASGMPSDTYPAMEYWLGQTFPSLAIPGLTDPDVVDLPGVPAPPTPTEQAALLLQAHSEFLDSPAPDFESFLAAHDNPDLEDYYEEMLERWVGLGQVGDTLFDWLPKAYPPAAYPPPIQPGDVSALLSHATSDYGDAKQAAGGFPIVPFDQFLAQYHAQLYNYLQEDYQALAQAMGAAGAEDYQLHQGDETFLGYLNAEYPQVMLPVTSWVDELEIDTAAIPAETLAYVESLPELAEDPRITPEFATIEEAEQWARENLLQPIEEDPWFHLMDQEQARHVWHSRVSYDGLTPDIANAFNEEFFRVKSRFGLGALDAISTNPFTVPDALNPDSVVASVITAQFPLEGQRVFINAEFVRQLAADGISLDSWQRAQALSGQFAGQGVRDLARHEAMHYLHRQLEARKVEEVTEAGTTFRRVGYPIPASYAVESTRDFARVVEDVWSRIDEQMADAVRENISEYALADSSEFFSELVVDVSRLSRMGLSVAQMGEQWGISGLSPQGDAAELYALVDFILKEVL